ncbi:MAG: hypothetical protein ABI602_04130 [Candidatus Saccharibacteria bacterium]
MSLFLPTFRQVALFVVLACLLTTAVGGSASAAVPPPKNPQSGSVGLEGTISSPAPTRGATITTPGNGATFTSVPITVNGLCPQGLLVKLFANNIFVGSIMCTTGSYSLQIDLFSGQNDLVARVYDALDQAGPDSNIVTVRFNDAQFLEFGTHVTLSSIYAKLGADPGDALNWPIIVAGGTGPYAISVDWGDGSPSDLTSDPFAGTLMLTHVYKAAGVYKITVKATDSQGGEAFLQLVGVGNGKVVQNSNASGNSSSITKIVVLWWPAVAMLPLIFAAFWIGRRHELFTLRKQLEKDRPTPKA